jgi:Na+-driven multidrug efflux pump
MGVSLSVSVQRTKWIAVATLSFSAVAFGILSILAYVFRERIVAIFTTNDEVKELAKEVWYKVCLFNFNVAIFGVLVGVATGLGKQWSLGIINFVCLFFFGLPVIYYSSITLNGGLSSAWTWINVPYLVMNICLVLLFVTTDWHAIQEKIHDRDVPRGEEANKEPEPPSTTETTSLLNNP